MSDAIDAAIIHLLKWGLTITGLDKSLRMWKKRADAAAQDAQLCLLSPPLLLQPDDYEIRLTHGNGREQRSRAMTGLLEMPRTYVRLALANGNGGSTIGLLKTRRIEIQGSRLPCSRLRRSTAPHNQSPVIPHGLRRYSLSALDLTWLR